MNIRKALISIAVVIVVIILSVLLSNFFIDNKKLPETREKEEILLYVKAEPVLYKVNYAGISATGRLTSQHAVDLSAEVSGQVLQGNVHLKEGTTFKKGDLLVHIFDEEAKSNLKASKSRFLNGIAGILPDMKIDFPESYNKWINFFNSINIDKPLPGMPDIDSDKEKVFLASRNILNDYFTIQSAQIRLSKYNIYAPFVGTFTNVMMEVGSVVNPGSRIATMIKTDKMELEVPVRIEDIYWVNIGDDVVASTQDGLLSWNGKVVRKSDYVDPNSQSITVFVAIEPTKSKPLYQGQYLKAVFSEKNLDSSMEIPRNAIFNKELVYTVENGKLEIHKVDILKTNETSALISGLEPGTMVVVEPLVNAQKGTNAEILN
jgi:multidrug efflux pump subunit AcrA (membrane-fusion protein)